MYLHAITPGDHFSPRTGSAVPTVVDGLSRSAAAGAPTSGVLVARGTYPERYDSAAAVEYAPRAPLPLGRYLDAATSRLSLPRFSARRVLGATVADQGLWEPSVILAHNAVQLVRSVRGPHVPVLYAHNELLRTYGRAEAGRALDPAPLLVCVSHYIAGVTAERLPAHLRDRLVVVPNGVDSYSSPRAPRARGERLHVVFVGRTIADKGPDLLLEAARRLGRDDPPSRSSERTASRRKHRSRRTRPTCVGRRRASAVRSTSRASCPAPGCGTSSPRQTSSSSRHGGPTRTR
jgi:glycosyltransferase involved in cell wall biosynthesis